MGAMLTEIRLINNLQLRLLVEISELEVLNKFLELFTPEPHFYSSLLPLFHQDLKPLVFLLMGSGSRGGGMTYGSGLSSHDNAGRSSHRCSGISPILVLAVRNVATDGGRGFLLGTGCSKGILGGLGGSKSTLKTSGEASNKSSSCRCGCPYTCGSSLRFSMSCLGSENCAPHTHGELPCAGCGSSAVGSGWLNGEPLAGKGDEWLRFFFASRGFERALDTTEVPLLERTQPPRASGSGVGRFFSFVSGALVRSCC